MCIRDRKHITESAFEYSSLSKLYLSIFSILILLTPSGILRDLFVSKVTISTIQSLDLSRDATDKDCGSSPKIIALFFLDIDIFFLLFVSFKKLRAHLNTGGPKNWLIIIEEIKIIETCPTISYSQ